MTEHFSLEELTRTNTGLNNAPDSEITTNLQKLADNMEEVRVVLGDKAIIIKSAYRSPAVNAAVGGSEKSSHMVGLAADFVCPAFGTPKQVCEAIAESCLEFDQLIYEFGSWVHLGIGAKMRREILTIDRRGARDGILEIRKL